MRSPRRSPSRPAPRAARGGWSNDLARAIRLRRWRRATRAYRWVRQRSGARPSRRQWNRGLALSADQRNDDRARELRRLQRARRNVRASLTVAAAENWTTGENGTYLSFYVTIPGGMTLVEALRIVGNQIEFKAAQADQSKVGVSPSTGFSQTIANDCTTLLPKPSGTLASGTVVMPAAPVDGQIARVSRRRRSRRWPSRRARASRSPARPRRSGHRRGSR
jgi:hypothetical protein